MSQTTSLSTVYMGSANEFMFGNLYPVSETHITHALRDEKVSERKLVRSHTPWSPTLIRTHTRTSYPHLDLLRLKMHPVSIVTTSSGILYTQ